MHVITGLRFVKKNGRYILEQKTQQIGTTQDLIFLTAKESEWQEVPMETDKQEGK